jgi:tryptophan synthase alpha chain
VPFLTAGYPDWNLFDAAVRALARSGADVLELGVPFSDPLADGPTIQASSQRALENGVTLTEILRRVEEGHSTWGLPVVLMTYANPILAYGVERFAADAAASGVAGVLVSDLPPEELPDLWRALGKAGLERVVLVAPTTTEARVPVLTEAADGYIYCITRTGVTGRGGAFASNLGEQVALVRRASNLPIVAGFGIRTPEDIAALDAPVDGVVVGARMIELLTEEPKSDGPERLERFGQELRRALDIDQG